MLGTHYYTVGHTFPRQLLKRCIYFKNWNNVPTHDISEIQNYEHAHIHKYIECRALFRHWDTKMNET